MAIVTRADKGAALTHTEMDNNFIELDTSPDGKVFPKTQNVGIKIDTNDPDYGWYDIDGFLYGDTTQSGTADLVPYRGGIKARQFHEGDESFVDFHMPHDYVMGSPLYIHVHWSHISTVVLGGSVTWAFELMYAKGHNQAAFPEPVVVAVVDNINPTQYQHQIAEGVASTIGGSAVSLDTEDLEVDGIIQCRLYLDSNDITTSDASTLLPFAHFVDLHYQSTGVPTKNKAPDFWT